MCANVEVTSVHLHRRESRCKQGALFSYTRPAERLRQFVVKLFCIHRYMVGFLSTLNNETQIPVSFAGIAPDLQLLLGPPKRSKDHSIEADYSPEDGVLGDVIEEAKVAATAV